jgi:hypothetical protein
MSTSGDGEVLKGAQEAIYSLKLRGPDGFSLGLVSGFERDVRREVYAQDEARVKVLRCRTDCQTSLLLVGDG